MSDHPDRFLRKIRRSAAVGGRIVLASLVVFLALLPAAGLHTQEIDPAPMRLGQSATPLPDGRWLLLGGNAGDGPADQAALWDPVARTTVALSERMQHARAWHAATLLPDGRVLITGGVGPDGGIIAQTELFDPGMGAFEQLDGRDAPRVYHTATLLTDGTVLIAGGVSASGHNFDAAELWDLRSGSYTVLQTRLAIARRSHTAELQPDGKVLISGGLATDGTPIDHDELFDPATQTFSTAPPPGSEPAARWAGSMPADGAVGVPIDVVVALRFSKPLRANSINSSTIVLHGPGGPIRSKVIPAEDGRLAFITPSARLAAGTHYTVRISGPTDGSRGGAITASFGFTTADTGGDEDWIPGPGNFQGDWTTGRPPSPWQDLPPLAAEPGVTAVSGQVLALNGMPLAGTTLAIDGVAVTSDATGRFLLRLSSTGHKVLAIDGRTSNQPGRTYGVFEAGIEVIEHQTNPLPFTIWMSKIDTAHAVSIASPTTSEVVVTTPRIPGLELHIPPQTVIRARGGNPVTSISITPIPVDRPPFPLPSGVSVPLYFTIQPGGSNVETLSDSIPHGARIVYPNYTGLPASARVPFWNYDPDGRGWYVYGQGTVTPNGQQIIPDLGVAIYRFTGAMIGFGGPPPAEAAAPGDGSAGGDPVDLGTGLFILTKTDIVLPDVLPIALVRTYRPKDNVVRPFGVGSNHSYDLYLYSTDTFNQMDLVLPDGGRIHYVRISGSTMHEGAYEHTATPTVFYKSQLFWNGSGWTIRLRDGTTYLFPDICYACIIGITAMRDRFGNQVTISRSPDMVTRVSRVAGPNGRYLGFSYDGSNRITRITDNTGRSVGYTYDAGGRVWKVTDPAGGVTEYTYDSSNRMLTLKDARGIVFLTNTYDANGRVSRQTQADSTTYQFGYTLDGTGKVTQTDVTDPRGFVRRVTFNASGYRLTDTLALGRPEQQTLTYTRLTGSNLISSVTDALGRRTDYAYDTLGSLTSVTRLAGTPNAVTTTMTYEPTYSQIATVTDPLSHRTTFSYDALGRLVSVADPLNNTTTIGRNSAGQPTSVTDPTGKTTTFTYDLGDLTAVTDPLGNPTRRFVDGAGRLGSLTNPRGNRTRYGYDALNRLLTVSDALGGVTAFSYDPNGNLLTVADARNGQTVYTYNTMDRLATRRDPVLVSESYGYDGNGNLSQFTDRRGQITGFTYDALNRRALATYADTSTTRYTYDAGSRLTQVVDSVSGTVTFTYDGLDRLTQEVSPQGTVNYTYDAAGRRSSMTVAGQPAVSYSYDNANRLTQITQGTSVVTFVYDAAGRRTSVTLPDGIVEEYSYDAASRLTEIRYKNGATLLGNLTYTYDATGNRTQIGGTWARTGLPQAVNSATYNAANRMLTFGAQSLTYDANGNLTSDGTNSYTWNARNQLASMTGASFVYDALGRRLTKTIGSASTSYLYDGVNPVQERIGGSPSANLITGLGVDEYFARTDSAGLRAFLTDALGSTVALADAAKAIQTQYTYEPYGKATVTGQSSTNPFQYTGRENDGAGLYYYRARYSNPIFSRFVSEDAILAPFTPFSLGTCRMTNFTIWPYKSIVRVPGSVTSQFFDAYSYTESNPIIRRDSSGLVSDTRPCGAQIEKCANDSGGQAYPPDVRACTGTQYRLYFGGEPGVSSCKDGKPTKECLTNDLIQAIKNCSQNGKYVLPESCTGGMLDCIRNDPNIK